MPPATRPASSCWSTCAGAVWTPAASCMRDSKDPAEAYAAGVEPLADVLSRRADVREMADGFEAGGLPRWEAVRRAALCIVDEGDGEARDTIEGATPNSRDDGNARAPPTQGQLLPAGNIGHQNWRTEP